MQKSELKSSLLHNPFLILLEDYPNKDSVKDQKVSNEFTFLEKFRIKECTYSFKNLMTLSHPSRVNPIKKQQPKSLKVLDWSKKRSICDKSANVHL